MCAFTINCPACGKCFDYPEVRENVFCSSCGRQLHLTWRLECVSIIGSSPGMQAAPAAQPAPQPAPSQGRMPQGYLKVTVNMPKDEIKMKGSFSHFMVMWDEKEIGTADKGGYVTLRTLAREHKLEIIQVNKKVVGTEEKNNTFKVPIQGDRVINVVIDGKDFSVE